MIELDNPGGIHGVQVIRSFPREVSGVSIDSRTMQEGDVFIAIKGDSFDGHDYLEEACEKGAEGLVVERQWHLEKGDTIPESLPLLCTVDTVVFLGQWANLHRKCIGKPVIGVTGSNGKTMTKDITASILSRMGDVHSSAGNFNNQIGLPLTLFGLHHEHDFCVLEMGINHPGELTYLCSIAEPDIGVITNVSTAHTEFFGDIEGVAHAKGELFSHLSADGTAIVNLDDAHIPDLTEGIQNKITYSLERKADLRGKITEVDEMGRISLSINESHPARLNVMGKAVASNALAAAAVGHHFGMEIEDILWGLESSPGYSGRLELMEVAGRTIINDSYNANPASVALALEVLDSMGKPGRKIVVFGDMLELGEISEEKHKSAGIKIAIYGFDALFAFGERAKMTVTEASAGGLKKVFHYSDKAQLAADLMEMTEPGDIILIKGSRGMAMEEVIQMMEGGRD